MDDKSSEASIRYAKKYLEDLLSFFGLNTDVRATCEEEVIELSVPSTHLNGFLIGQRGDTLRSLQFTVSSALKNNDYELTRVNVDIANYKAQHREKLAEKAEEWIAKAIRSGEPMHLRPMNGADRRVVHKTAAEHPGIESDSEGEGRDRHIVLTPTGESAEAADDLNDDTEQSEENDE